MKKFSFKKLTTISLFFTSVIFLSGFTTCFIPTISTNHSNDQPNATKIDLKDYNGKMLPNPVDRPDEYVSQWYEEMLLGQLKNAKGQTGWENWNCYLNQFELTEMAFNTDGGSFRIAAKTNAVNYVGSSTASIRFKYYLQTTLSTLIPNDSVLPIVVDYDLWTNNEDTVNHYLLNVLKQQYGLDINEIIITPDYSSPTYNNPWGTIEIQAKNNSVVYSGSTTIKFQFVPYPKYATSGCVAIYNAIYNTGFRSHTDGDVQWFNSADGTDTINKLNTTFGDNYAEMPSNGVSSTFGFIAPYSFDQIFGANGFTLEAVFQQSKRTTGEIIIMCDYGQGGIGINIRTSSPYDLYFEYYLGGYKYIYSNQEISLDTLYSVSVVNDIPKDQLSIYINGTSAIETTSINATGPQDNSKWGIGNNVGGTTINNAGMWGRYYCLRVYNQPLTEQQVQNNYNVDHDLFFQ